MISLETITISAAPRDCTILKKINSHIEIDVKIIMHEKIYIVIPASMMFRLPNRSLSIPAKREKIARPKANPFNVRLEILGLTPKSRVIKGREDI